MRLRIGGCRLVLSCPDIDGVTRAITGSGYDLEEGMVDTFAKPAIEHLSCQVDQRFGLTVGKIFRQTAEEKDNERSASALTGNRLCQSCRCHQIVSSNIIISAGKRNRTSTPCGTSS